MADEPLSGKERVTPSDRAEENAGTEPTGSDTGTRDTETAEDVKADAAIEDRFEATDN